MRRILVAALTVSLVGGTVYAVRPAAQVEPISNAGPREPLQSQAMWTRHPSLQALMGAGTTDVVTVTVESVATAPPIKPQAAGAPADAPELPRVAVSAVVDQTWHGDLDGRVRIVQVLPPGGVPFAEDPEYRPGERALLFLRPSSGPSPIPGAYDVVSVDGRFRLADDGSARGLIEGGPAPEIARAATDGELEAALKEAAR